MTEIKTREERLEALTIKLAFVLHEICPPDVQKRIDEHVKEYTKG